MRALVSKMSLIIFAVLLIGSLPSLSVPGKRSPSYAFAAAFALFPLFAGPRALRGVAAVGLVICALLITGDYEDGKAYREKVQRLIQKYQDEARTNQSGEQPPATQ